MGGVTVNLLDQQFVTGFGPGGVVEIFGGITSNVLFFVVKKTMNGST